MTRKRELDEEKLTIQRQMEKKDSEINDLNTKLNEKISELQSLKTDKKVLEEQLVKENEKKTFVTFRFIFQKEMKTLSETIGNKNSLIEKLQQQINEEKRLFKFSFRFENIFFSLEFGVNEQTRLKDEINGLKNRL